MRILSWYRSNHLCTTYGSSGDTPESIASRKAEGFIPMDQAMEDIIHKFSNDRKIHNEWLISHGHPEIGFREHGDRGLTHWRVMRELSLGS